MSASVWNNAGTWEEKDCSEWAKEQLQTGLAVEAGTARVTNVTNVKGLSPSLSLNTQNDFMRSFLAGSRGPLMVFF